MKARIAGIAALSVALLGGTSFTAASAAPITFFGEDLNGPPNNDPNAIAAHPNADAARAAFFSNLVGVGTETFDTIPVGTTNPVLAFPGCCMATITGTGEVATGNDGSGRYPISAPNYFESGTGNFGIEFDSPIAAFGFYGVDISDYGADLTLTLTDTLLNETVIVVPNTISPNGEISGSVIYFGFYDTAALYTSISFENSFGAGDVFGFDSFSVGSIEQVVPRIPEPGTLFLFGAGLLAYGWARRRKA